MVSKTLKLKHLLTDLMVGDRTPSTDYFLTGFVAGCQYTGKVTRTRSTGGCQNEDGALASIQFRLLPEIKVSACSRSSFWICHRRPDYKSAPHVRVRYRGSRMVTEASFGEHQPSPERRYKFQVPQGSADCVGKDAEVALI